MEVYLCLVWDVNDRIIDTIICASLEEVKKAYAEFLLTIDSKEYYEKERIIPFDEMVELWYQDDDFFEIKKLKVRGL